jgi:hypothetical protein
MLADCCPPALPTLSKSTKGLMIHDRSISSDDLSLIASAIEADEQSKRPAEFFTEPGSVANIYEDETGPLVVIRGIKSLRLDAQILTTERAQGRAAIALGVSRLAKKARENGFKEIVFRTDAKDIADLALGFGFVAQDGEYRKAI